MKSHSGSRGRGALLGAVVGVLLASAPAVVWAADRDRDPVVGMAGKLVRGVVNAATGWLEVPMAIVEHMEREPLTGLFVGIFDGSARAVYRTGAGAFEAGTFFAPIPRDFRPITSPQTTFGDLE